MDFYQDQDQDREHLNPFLAEEDGDKESSASRVGVGGQEEGEPEEGDSGHDLLEGGEVSVWNFE